MVYKTCIGDFPLLDYPCKYWWVRYGVACTYLKKQFDKMWSPKFKEIQEKYKFTGLSHKGKISLMDLKSDEDLEPFLNLKIYVYDNKKQIEVTNTQSELYQFLIDYLREQEQVHWGDCPYEKNHQSKCPFYEKNDFYEKTSLTKLRERKGYDV